MAGSAFINGSIITLTIMGISMVFANLIHFLTALIKPYQVIIQSIYVKAFAQNLD